MANQDTLYEIESGIAIITLNRPEQMNTLGGTMMALVSQYIQQRKTIKRCGSSFSRVQAACFAPGWTWWAPNLERAHKRVPTMLPPSR